MKDKALIIYHKEDNDGVFSAALIRNYLVYEQQYEKEDVICTGFDYNDSAEITKEDIDNWRSLYTLLVITDMSLNVDIMEYAYKVFDSGFVWFDHHKPIILAAEKYKASSRWAGERSTDRSAIMLAWKYCYDPFDINWNDNRYKIPEILNILSAWDSFTYEKQGYTLDYVRKMNEGINQLFNLDFVEVYKFLERAMYLYPVENEFSQMLQKAFTTGTLIVNFQQRINDNLIKNCGDKEWTIGDDNRKACMLVCQGPSNSLIFDSLKNSDIKSGIVFKYSPNDGEWIVSLYNIDDKDTKFHCGDYMRKHYKGGGHLGAAGGKITQRQFEKILKAKHI